MAIALLITSFSAVHIIAHLFNFERFMDSQLMINDSYLPYVLSQIGNNDNRSYLNPIRSNETVSLPSFFTLHKQAKAMMYLCYFFTCITVNVRFCVSRSYVMQFKGSQSLHKKPQTDLSSASQFSPYNRPTSHISHIT